MEPGEIPNGASDGGDYSAPAEEPAGDFERPSFISEEGWNALPDGDREVIRRERQRSNDLTKNYRTLHASVSRLEGLVEGLKSGAGARGQNGNGSEKREVSDYSDQELRSFLSQASAVREAYRANPEDPEVKRKYSLLGDGTLEEESRIELAARRAEQRTGKKVEEMESRNTQAARAQAFHKRLLGITGPQVMSQIMGENGSLKDDHPLVMAARERAEQMLAERQIDPKNQDAVFVVIERAFEEVVADQRGRGGSGRESPRGRLEMMSGRSADPAQRGRPAAGNISVLLRQGKVAEAHEASLLDHLLNGTDMPAEFSVRMPR